MPHFRVDDMIHSHPKARRAGLVAMGLWTLCGSWSMSYKTDGFVPAWFAHAFPNGRRVAAELIAAELWSEGEHEGEHGYRFHDWLDWQPSAEEIERDRERQRARSREFRRRLRDGKKERSE